MKTKMINIITKTDDFIVACGECFTEVERGDDYCRNCGVEFMEDWAYSKEELLKSSHSQNHK